MGADNFADGDENEHIVPDYARLRDLQGTVSKLISEPEGMGEIM